jgi:cyanate permease
MAWFERRRVRALTIVTVFGGLASTVFYPLTAWLVEVQGWRSALLTLALILAVTTIPIHALVLRPRPAGPHPDARLLSPHPAPTHAAASVPLRALLRQPAFRWLLMSTCLNQLASAGAAVHLIPYLVEQGHESTLAATLAGLVGVLQVAGRLAYAPFGDRLPVLRSTTALLLLEPVGLLALLLLPGVPGVLLFVALFGAGRGISSVTRPAVVVHMFGAVGFAGINGILALVVALARALGPVSVGAGRDVVGSYDPSLFALALFAFAAAAALAQVRVTRPTSAP